MRTAPVWHGTADEMDALMNACRRHCECVSNEGLVTATCPAHAMLTEQRILNDLLFVRRIAQRLRVGEFGVDAV